MAYAADGLTVNWFDRHPDKLPEWWATNSRGENGFSYCIVNASPDPTHAAVIQKHLSELTTAPYEVLLFADDKSMTALKPHCKYSWVMRISDDSYKVVSGYCPKVSIIIPTYKRQHVLFRTVQSLLAQSYQNWELIVVNNERGGKVSLPTDPRITVYEHCEEANACYARNAGLQHASGDLICFFDDDDIMFPDYLSKMAAPFANPEVQVVRCGMLCTFGACDFSYSTQEAWLRRAYATPTWSKGSAVHDQIYYHSIVAKNGWTRKNIVQLGEVLVKAYSEPKGGIREGGF